MKINDIIVFFASFVLSNNDSIGQLILTEQEYLEAKKRLEQAITITQRKRELYITQKTMWKWLDKS